MKNNKVVKGIVAGALGLSLLIGGGTFAVWYDSQSVTTGSVNSGSLAFKIGTQTWKSGATPISIDAYKVVPGDVLTLTSNIAITAQGTNLKATLNANTAGLIGDAQLRNALTIGLDVTGLTTAASKGAVEVTSADNGKTAVAVLTIAFPSVTSGTLGTDRANWWGSTAQNQKLDLSSIKFELTQHL